MQNINAIIVAGDQAITPCPVCANDAMFYSKIMDGSRGYVMCTTCGKQGIEAAAPEAITTWNATAKLLGGTVLAIDMQVAVKQRRLGKFVLSHRMVTMNPLLAHRILRHVLVIGASILPESYATEYIAYCSLFNPSPEGLVLRTYTFDLDALSTPQVYVLRAE